MTSTDMTARAGSEGQAENKGGAGTIGGYLMVFAGVALFATVEVASKGASQALGFTFPAMLMTAFRFAVSGLLFVLITQVNPARKARIPAGRGLIKTAVLGILAAPVAIGLFHYALTFEAFKASSGAAIFSINPIFAAVIAHIALKERASPREWTGLILGFAGALVMSLNLKETEMLDLFAAGSIMIASAFLFALNVVLSKPMILKYGGFCYTGWAFFIGGTVALAAAALMGDMQVLPLLAGRTTGILIIMWIVLGGTAAAYYAYMVGLSKVNVTRGSYLFFTKPFMAIIIALIFIGQEEWFSWVEWSGFGMIMTGLGLIVFKKGRFRARRT